MAEADSHLTQMQRCQIEIHLSSGESQRAIARMIGVSPSTVSREVKRNSKVSGSDDAAVANQLAVARRSAASRRPRKVTEAHLDFICDGLLNGHSPDVIANALDAPHLQLSTAWIYELLDREVANGEDECKNLLWRKYRKRIKSNGGVHLIPHRRDISERPPQVDTRREFGHWEGDTIVGAHHQGAIVTLIERQTRYLKCFAVNARTKDAVADGIIRVLGPLAHSVRTITFDNGGEFAAHERVAHALDCDVYFARPYRSWERGANENVNGLLRRYFPKGQTLLDVDEDRLAWSESWLNTRYRRALGFDTAHECFEMACRELLSGSAPPI